MRPSALLVAIDCTVVTAFGLSGMLFHSTQGAISSEFLRISAPFFLGICATAWAFEAYEPTASGRVFVKRSGLGLGWGLALSLMLRSVQRGALPLSEFLLPTSLFFLLLTSLLKGLFWKFSLRKRTHS